MKSLLVLIVLIFCSQYCLAQKLDIAAVDREYPQNFRALQDFSIDENIKYLSRRAKGYRNIATVFGVSSVAIITYAIFSSATPIRRFMLIGLGSFSGIMGISIFAKYYKYKRQKDALLRDQGLRYNHDTYHLSVGVTSNGVGLSIKF